MNDHDRRQCPTCGRVQYLSLGGNWYHVANESASCKLEESKAEKK